MTQSSEDSRWANGERRWPGGDLDHVADFPRNVDSRPSRERWRKSDVNGGWADRLPAG
jgi:hypothetical protein